MSLIILLNYGLLFFNSIDINSWFIKQSSLGLRYVSRGIYFMLQDVLTFHVYVFKVIDGIDAARKQFLDAEDVNVVLF